MGCPLSPIGLMHWPLILSSALMVLSRFHEHVLMFLELRSILIEGVYVGIPLCIYEYDENLEYLPYPSFILLNLWAIEFIIWSINCWRATGG